MKGKADLVRGWILKGASDMSATEALLKAGVFDSACFHAQQAAGNDEDFRLLSEPAKTLTPYAVELRYDEEFWPSRSITAEAAASAAKVRDFVRDRLPGKFFAA